MYPSFSDDPGAYLAPKCYDYAAGCSEAVILIQILAGGLGFALALQLLVLGTTRQDFETDLLSVTFMSLVFVALIVARLGALEASPALYWTAATVGLFTAAWRFCVRKWISGTPPTEPDQGGDI